MRSFAIYVGLLILAMCGVTGLMLMFDDVERHNHQAITVERAIEILRGSKDPQAISAALFVLDARLREAFDAVGAQGSAEAAVLLQRWKDLLR